jgi:cytochrome c
MHRHLLLLLAGIAAGGMASAQAAGDAQRGRDLYEQRCIACHAIDASRAGPMHRGVHGRKAGGVPGFVYSPALRASAIAWDDRTLDLWLADPQKLIPGQRMNFRVADPRDRADIIAWLRLNPAR